MKPDRRDKVKKTVKEEDDATDDVSLFVMNHIQWIADR